VVGHYGCGGVAAAANNKQYGLIDGWLTNIRDVIRVHETEFLRIKDEDERLRRLVELNVIEQVRNLAKTSIIQNAWKTETPPRLHGLVYDIKEGLLKDLEVEGGTMADLSHIYSTQSAAHVEVVPAEPEAASGQPAPTVEEAKADKKSEKTDEKQLLNIS
jgi:carbonic anhydrase